MELARMYTILLIIVILLALNSACQALYAGEYNFDSFPDSSDLFTSSSPQKVFTALLDKSNTYAQRASGTKKITNPHWKSTLCNICHETPPNSSSDKKAPHDTDDKCIECHKEDITHSYIHPVDISLKKSRKKEIEKNWDGNLRLSDNDKLSCLTCHDPLDQCLPERKHLAKHNSSFLRDGPYPTRYSLCYRCHDAEKYNKKNPHDQIGENGLLKLKMCRLCHEISIDQNIKSGIKKDFDKFPLLEGMNEDRTLLCVRCHKKIDHPSSAFRVRSEKKYRHLVKISPYKKETLERESKETGIILPLEPYTKRIYCGTCHQPHQPGVFVGEKFEPLPMSNKRLRSKPICKYCHDIYGSTSSN